MSQITLDEANKIAYKYFQLLIDRHIAQGFSAQVVEKKSDKSKMMKKSFMNCENKQF